MYNLDIYMFLRIINMGYLNKYLCLLHTHHTRSDWFY